jgi:hypothetical protein
MIQMAQGQREADSMSSDDGSRFSSRHYSHRLVTEARLKQGGPLHMPGGGKGRQQNKGDPKRERDV